MRRFRDDNGHRSLRMGARLVRVIALALVFALVGAPFAYADVTTDSSTTLSSSVSLPSTVSLGANPFTIVLWGTNGTFPKTKNGTVEVVTAYSMAASGAITPGAATTTIVFPDVNYGACPSSGTIPPGCPGNPLLVSASLAVAADTPGGTAGLLTVSMSPGTGSGINVDASPAQGRVQVANSAPTVGTIGGSTSVNEGSTSSYSVSASDPDGDTLSYAWSVALGNGAISGAGNNAATSVQFGDGPSLVVIQVVVDDGNAHPITRTLTATNLNVAPSATFGAPASVNEGSSFVVSLSDPSDPSTVDVGAGFTYAFDCGDGAGYQSFGAGSDQACTTDDDGSRTVRGQIRDQNSGVREYNATVVVENVAPSALFTAASPVDEGSDISLAFGGVSDPSDVDTAAGFTYAFDCGDGAGYQSFGAGSDQACTTDDDGTRTVRGQVRDQDDGVREYTITSVAVENVAPTATLHAPGSVNEGNAIGISISEPLDPSTVDAAGLTYAFDCGEAAGYGDFTSTAAVSCPTLDNGGRTVRATVRDKDGGFTAYTAQVSVLNVAPTATFSAPASVDEGSPIELSLTNPADVSGIDAAAPFTYAFDCGDGFNAYGTTPTRSCPTSDDESRPVGGRIMDKDGGVREYTATVSVANVAPAVSAGDDAAIAEGGTFERTGSFADPGADTWTATVDYGDGGGTEDLALTGSSFTLNHTYAQDGAYTVTVVVHDDDDYYGSDAVAVAVANAVPIVTLAGGAINEGAAFSGSGSFTDPGADVWTATIDYGDGTGVQSLELASDKTFSLGHTYGDDGSYTVTVRVRDDDMTGTGMAIVDVANVAPAVVAGGDRNLDEGSTFSQAGSFADPGADVWSATVDYGDGSGEQPLAPAGTSFDLAHTYVDQGTFTVTVTVDDDDDGSGTDTVVVTVANVAPNVNAGSDVTINEGGTFARTGSFADPGTDLWTATVDYGDGSPVEPLLLLGKAFSLSHPYADNPTGSTAYTVTVVIDDGDGGVSADSVEVTVSNIGPSVDAGEDATIDEGDLFTRGGSFTDPGADSWSATVDYGDTPGAAELTLSGKTFSLDHTYTDDGSYDATVTVTDGDGDGGSGSDAVAVTVANVAPAVDAGEDVTIAEGDTLSRAGSFTDPGADTWTATVDYGDGDEQELGLELDNSFSLGRTYAQDGEYTVTVTVADDDGGSDTATFLVTVDNVAPVLDVGLDGTIAEGDTFSQSGFFADPGADTWTATVNYGDGGVDEALTLTGSSFTLNHTYAQDGAYTVTVVVYDDDAWDSGTLIVTVLNVAPSVTVVGGNGFEGAAFSGSGSFTDPGADVWTATIDYGDGTGVQSLSLTGTTFVLSHTYGDDRSYTVAVSVADDDTAGTGRGTASIANVAPTVALLSSASTAAAVACATGNTVQLNFTVTDPAGPNDPILGTVQWGDGSLTTYSGGSFIGSHTFVAGTFTIEVTANDGDGGTASVPRQVAYQYTTTGILPPVNPDGSTVVQRGSTVPTKISVADCTGRLVSTLTPTVHLERLAPAPTAGVTQVVSTSAADTGQTMRWAGNQYLYNLSTKRSAFNAGQDLANGYYHLWVTSPAFAPIDAYFTMRG